jgi:hypothetical protein
MVTDKTQDKTMNGASPKPANINLEHDTIAALAYQLWLLRARPIGSPEVDWFRAEQELNSATNPVPKTA